MTRNRYSIIAHAAAGLLLAAAATSGAAAARPLAPGAGLSVLTYNVEGLPWPVRLGRDLNFSHMSASLNALRSRGLQPHVIVLQEAFTPAAKRIATDAGYSYIADGPAAADGGVRALTAADRAFASNASALRGEREGKWLDSGLRIASDYPIESVRRMAFPAYACAGFDCLANKGVLAVTVRVPGSPSPVVIVATHLNSRAAAHVGFSRSLYAYQRQLDALGQFVRAAVPADSPLVFAGDFNAGHRVDRRTYLIRSAAAWRTARPVSVALDTSMSSPACHRDNHADIQFSFMRGRDWQFFSPGRAVAIGVTALSAPFGRDRTGAMLSDHVGYTASYSLTATGA